MILLSLVFLGLFAVMMASPAAYAGLYGVAAGEGATFLGQRWSPMLIAMAVLTFGFRDLAPSHHRSTWLIALAVMFGGFAISGTLDFLEGQANARILGSAVLEVGVVAACLWLMRA